MEISGWARWEGSSEEERVGAGKGIASAATALVPLLLQDTALAVLSQAKQS